MTHRPRIALGPACEVLRPAALTAPASAAVRFAASRSGPPVVAGKGDPDATASVTFTISEAGRLELPAACSDTSHIDLHTTSSQAGAARGQLRPTRS